MLLQTYTRSHSGRSITLEPQGISTGYPNQMLNNAKILIEQVVDARVVMDSKGVPKATLKKTVHASNFLHLLPNSTILPGTPKSTDGYIVFNSNNQCVQDYGPGKGISREVALQYIDCVLNGRFPRNMDYENKKLFVRSYHLLSYKVLRVNGVPVFEYCCRCKVHRGQGECEHEIAGAHILGTFDVYAQVQQIQSGSVRGRPRKNVSVGYAARKVVDSSIVVTSLHAVDYEKIVNEKIVQFFARPFSKQPFVGTITGA